jgi:TAT (twin-arginine translocation) pathway signal sequence
MSRKDDEQNRAEEENVEVKLEMKRRDFLKTLALAGGALAAAPAVQAFAAGKTFEGVVQDRAFNIALPARYSVQEPSLLLNVTLAGGTTTTVSFAAKGAIQLAKTSDPKVAAVSITGLTLSSSSDPLPGLDTGVISAQVPSGTGIGSLNLSTGVLTEHPFPIVVSFERNHGPVTTNVTPLAAQISENPAGARKKCTKKNDVTIPVPATPTLPGSMSRGTIDLGLAPVLSGGVDPHPA